ECAAGECVPDRSFPRLESAMSSRGRGVRGCTSGSELRDGAPARRIIPLTRLRTQRLQEAMGKEVEVAILFADVVGSTQLYEQLGDAQARQMVGRCLNIMREATEACGGTVIKTMGDEVMATFLT